MALFVGADRQAKVRDPCGDCIKVSELFTSDLHHSEKWATGFAHYHRELCICDQIKICDSHTHK